MAASAAILLCGVQTASAEVCDKVYDFDYSDLAPISAATEFLMLAAGPTGGLLIFFVGLFVVTRRPGVLIGLSTLLGIIGLSEILSSGDDMVFTSMRREGGAPDRSFVGPVFLAVAMMIAVFAIVTLRRRASAEI